MGKKELEQYLKKFELKYIESCFFDTDVLCPVIINGCDASFNGRSFSESVIDISVESGLPIFFFFLIGSKKLLSYLDKNTERSDGIARLEEFIANKQHQECLLSLAGNKEYSEYNIQVILAAHLFGPLAGSYEIGKKGFPKDARRCPKCGLDISEYLKNTSLGNAKVWHGYADILVNRSVVKIVSEDDEEDGSGEPLRKRMRTGSIGDDESSTSDEEYVSDSIVEVKTDAINSQALSQILSQTIVNAFAEVNKDQVLSNYFIPSFIVTPRVLRITMYNCGLDYLLLSDNLDLFIKDEEDKLILNVQTILNVWYSLNFENYYDKRSEQFLEYHTSDFKKQAGKMYKVYNEECTKPMKEAEKGKEEIKFKTSVDCLLRSEQVRSEAKDCLDIFNKWYKKKPE